MSMVKTSAEYALAQAVGLRDSQKPGAIAKALRGGGWIRVSDNRWLCPVKDQGLPERVDDLAREVS